MRNSKQREGIVAEKLVLAFENAHVKSYGGLKVKGLTSLKSIWHDFLSTGHQVLPKDFQFFANENIMNS